MRFERLDLNLLVALNALLESQNVSLAAERVCLSQSAMSGALSRLREYFEDELLTPIGRKMVLTPRAEELVEPVRNALHLIRSTIATRPEFDPSTSDRTFTVMASDYVVDVILSSCLLEIHKIAPHMRIDIVSPGPGMLDRMEQGACDLFIMVEPYLLPGHPSEQLVEDRHAVLAWEGNTLVSDPITVEQYYEVPHITVAFGYDRSPVAVENFLEMGARKRRFDLSVPFFGMVPNLLVGTNRVATILRRQAEHYARLFPLKVHPVPVEVPNVQEAMQWHRLKSSDQGIAWLRERLRWHAQNEGLNRVE